MSPVKRSPIALAVLAMLTEAPMHPYRMQRLIKERGKDEVINVTQRASLYQTIQRLEREGLIAARQTLRDEGRPQRTVYEITDAGRTTAIQWLRDILATPAAEYPEFPAAISFLPMLAPEDALRQLTSRIVAIEAELARIDAGLQQAAAVPRLFLLEIEYLRVLQVTELNWVRGVAEDLRAGRLKWSAGWLRKIAAQFGFDPASDSE
ncbi:MAG TPA: PadR family transcriptional regulator [Steroidobacteraceae bacterium]|nr:PadR family transcriptional regulator [Steroidobacteraceae bacterium]